MLDLTVFNLPRGLVALKWIAGQKVSLKAQFEGRTTYLTYPWSSTKTRILTVTRYRGST